MFDSLLAELGIAPAKKIQVKSKEASEHNIVLFNDDVNTFDFVIECLINYCEHEETQAEQCAFLVHYKGKCIVKNGSKQKLTPICSALLDKGLSAEIQ